MDLCPRLNLDVNREDVDLWRETASKYALFRGEVTAFPYVEYYEKLARVRGIENSSAYAVAFGMPESARGRRLSQL